MPGYQSTHDGKQFFYPHNSWDFGRCAFYYSFWLLLLLFLKGRRQLNFFYIFWCQLKNGFFLYGAGLRSELSGHVRKKYFFLLTRLP